MDNINQKIDEVILKYQLDRYYPEFRRIRSEKDDGKKGSFLSVVLWKDDYYYINNSFQIDQSLMERVDTVVLEVDWLLTRLTEITDGEKEKEYLERLFFLAIYKRNFLLAEEMLQRLLINFPEKSVYKKAWGEINVLIENLKRELRNRKYQDIIGIWLDAVSYENTNEIPYLKEVRETNHTVSFSNAYTMTPCTNPTFALIMTGKKRIDDKSYLIKKIDGSNSEVIALLEEKGYICKFIGSYWKQVDNRYSSAAHYIYAPCSEMLWDMVCNLSAAAGQVFLLTHIFSELHCPYTSMNQRTYSDCTAEMRRLRGREEVDRQLRYFMDFIGINATRLYFSDHGDNWLSKDVFHTVLEIQGENFQKEEIEEIFSYVKFPELLKQLILGNKIEKALLISDYAEIQEIPLYDKKLIEKKIKNRIELYSNEIWGYRGIIDRDFIYLYHGESDEEIRESLLENDHKNIVSNMFYTGYYYICDENAILHYRKKMQREKEVYHDAEKMKYSYYLQRIAENAMPCHNKKLSLLCRLFDSLPNKGLAFRSGGFDTERIFSLYRRQLNGLEYIIDNDQNCRCARLGIPIIPVSDLAKYPIRIIILSSKRFAKEFRKESSTYPTHIQVVDIYRYLEDNGIVEKNSFYYFQPRSEDYDVGFPFEE